MLADPRLDLAELKATLRAGWGVDAATVSFIPSYDPDTASFEVSAAHDRFFLKVYFGSPPDTAHEVPRALVEAGVPNILAPIRTGASTLSAPMGERSLALYPFVPGPNAAVAGMTDDQWRTFGATLRAVHDSGVEQAFGDHLRAETFSLAAAAPVREVLELIRTRQFESPAARRFAEFWRAHTGRIGAMLDRAVELGAVLQTRSLDRVLCHSDIHAANIIVTDAGIHLVDWDGPMVAPRERDLLFVIGSRIAREVLPHEERWFFEGYGAVQVDLEAIIYYRYERILEDIGVDGASVFGDASQTEATRRAQVDLVMSFFAPGGILETAERVYIT